MPARDLYHAAVIHALTKEGWKITHDPLRLKLRGGRYLFVDLGAERLIAAEKGTEKIAVEVKSFVGPSDMRDLEGALGQFVLYVHMLKRLEPDRILYLAIPEAIRATLFEEEVGLVLLEEAALRVVSFDPEQEVIVRWIP